ncbi:MAG: acetate kinase, partial [Desulfobacterales bacterium]|nr:acetate kinase [Desulfobacterales bacterium]
MPGQDLVLVINSGSSSVKCKVFAMPGEQVQFSGQVDGIGIGGNGAQALLTAGQSRGLQLERSVDCGDHGRAIELILDLLASDEYGLGNDFSRICVAGHRVVHGGNRFCAPVMVNEPLIDELAGLSELAPLYIPINVLCIRACREKLPKTPMAACFDTAFSHDMPEYARLYPVP